MKRFIPPFFILIILIYLLYLIKPAILGQLGGTFKPVVVPEEYMALEKYISSQKSFFRTFWVPNFQRFGYHSNSHPAISANGLYNTVDNSQILKNLRKDNAENLFQEAAIKYLIVPYDSQEEIFIKDRKYNEKIYLEIIKNISSIGWLKEVKGFGRIAVFEVPNPKDHFWTPDKLEVKYKYINPTKYEVNVIDASEGDVLVFSESFDKYWQARGDDFEINSSRFNKKFNSFILPRNGDYSLTVYYTPQDWVNIGLIVSGVSLASILLVLIGFKLRKW